MNSQTSHLPESSQVGSVSDVLKLVCPFCQGTLNLRRIHLGIEGECVHCHKPVTAVEDDSGCRLVSSMGIPDSPFPSAAGMASPVDPTAEILADSGPEPVAEKALEMAPAQPVETNLSPWGFPQKESEEVPPDASFSPLEKEVDPQLLPDPQLDVSGQMQDDAPAQPVEEVLFQLPSHATDPFQITESASVETEEPASVPPPLPEQEETAPFSSPGAMPFQGSAQAMDISSQLVEEPEAVLFQSSDVPPPLEAAEESVFQSPPPLEAPLEAPSTGNAPPALPETFFNSPEEEVSKAVVTNRPVPGGISPFSTGSAKRVDPGFAETLFTGQADFAAAPAPPSRPDIPDMSPPDDVAFNAANQWGPAPVSKTADGEELDFSAIPTVVKEKAPSPSAAGAPVHKPLPRKRKSGSGIFKKIFKFFLTIGMIGGIAFAANTFVPAAKWGEWKQQAIDWLEPGSVILEKLPFGKNKSTAMKAPAKEEEPAIRTRQQISEELLQIPQRQPGG